MRTKTELLPFQGYNTSGCQKMNFLFKYDNIYIMDNHRAALWCWFQEIDISKKYNIFHIDRHYDLSKSNLFDLPNIKTKLPSMTLQTYLNLESSDVMDMGNGERYKVIRWDNYFSFMFEFFPENINRAYLATHELFDNPNYIEKFEEIKVHSLLRLLEDLFEDEDEWIINIDIDYFFAESSSDKPELYSDDLLSRIGNQIKDLVNNKRAKVVTFALSPECCPGWLESINMLNKIANSLDIRLEV